MKKRTKYMYWNGYNSPDFTKKGKRYKIICHDKAAGLMAFTNEKGNLDWASETLFITPSIFKMIGKKKKVKKK